MIKFSWKDAMLAPFMRVLITTHAGIRTDLWYPCSIQISMEKFQKNYQKYLIKCRMLSPKIILIWNYLIERRTLQVTERHDASTRTCETSFFFQFFIFSKTFRKKYISYFKICTRGWRVMWTITYNLISQKNNFFLLPMPTLVGRTYFTPRVHHNLDFSYLALTWDVVT